MKREDLFQAVGDLDDALLDENVTEIKKTSKIRYILPIAACLVLVCGVAAIPLATGGGLPVGENVTPMTNAEVPETQATEELTNATETSEIPTETTPPTSEVVTLEALPPREEWLNQVYFGSEFPYFIYGNEDYCVFSEGTSGLFVYDFKEEKITFSANITDSFDKAGVAHGIYEYGWNGVAMSAYRENGEVKLLCIADTGSTEQKPRGFKLDSETATLTEIPDFDRENYDIINYTYNTPYNSMDFLFGAAPIPLEDGYICFGNSGLNNEILPGEGSHLPMIEIQKVKGEQVKKWVPFAYMVESTRCGPDVTE